MALQAVEEDPLSNTEDNLDNLLSDELSDHSSQSNMAKDSNCYMRDSIMALHR